MRQLCIMVMVLSILMLGCGAETDIGYSSTQRGYSSTQSPTWAALVQATDENASDEGNANGVFDNRVVVAITAAAVGILLTGTVNIILQYIGDRRRFKNEREVQKEQRDHEAKVQREQWDQEAKVQRERWEREGSVQMERWKREDTLRNYDERRRAYIETLRATDALGLMNLNRANLTDSATFLTTAARAKAELRALAPVDVVFAGEQLITAYNNCVMDFAANQRIQQDKADQLNQRTQQFATLTQVDLGLIETTDPRARAAYQDIYREVRERNTQGVLPEE